MLIFPHKDCINENSLLAGECIETLWLDTELIKTAIYVNLPVAVTIDIQIPKAG
jgi:hypothetical protein